MTEDKMNTIIMMLDEIESDVKSMRKQSIRQSKEKIPRSTFDYIFNSRKKYIEEQLNSVWKLVRTDRVEDS